MSFSKISAFAGAVALATRVAAHGIVTGVVADGVYYQGYSPSFQYQNPAPVVVGWSAQNLDNGFVEPASFGDPDIICHKGAKNAQTSATVKAGGTVELQWSVWPESHHGPVIDYLASCNGDCKTVDKKTLEFFKIDGVGLIDGSAPPGKWASDTLIANNNTWAVTIPSDIAPGSYVLRHEIIALHASGDVNGAQNYPQCINLEVTGSGTATPAGTLGTALYTETDPGILISIYKVLSSYIIPGPPIYDGAASPSQSPVASVSATSTAAGEVSSALAVTNGAESITTSVPVVGDAVSSSPFAGYLNTTVPTGCPRPSRTHSGRPTNRPKPISSSVAIASTTIAVDESVTPTVTIPTSIATVLPVESTFPTSAPVQSVSSLPEGTTLNDVLAWMAAFYNKHGKGSYTSATVARRHARDVAAIAAKREAFDRSGGLRDS